MNQPVIISSSDRQMPESKPIFITPVMAKALLSRNLNNRVISEPYVDILARDMAIPGHWDLNGETVKLAWATEDTPNPHTSISELDTVGLSRTGNILDGQHRLLAICRAAANDANFKGAWLFVVSNLDPRTRRTVDTGRRRSFGDELRMGRGEAHHTTLAAVLKFLWKFDNGDRRNNTHPSPSGRDMEEFLDKHPEVRRSVEIASRVRQEFPAITPLSVGASHFILTRVDENYAPWFFARLADGADEPRHSPIWTFRRRISNDRIMGVKHTPVSLVGGIIFTWNHEQQRRANPEYRLSKYYYDPSKGIPEPELYQPTLVDKKK